MNDEEYIELIANKIRQNLDKYGIDDFWITDCKMNYPNCDSLIIEEVKLDFIDLNKLLENKK